MSKLLERTQELSQDSLGNLEREEVFDYNIGSMNRIIINMDRLLASQGHDADVVLEPHDRIYVPSVPTGISVMGAVGSNGTLGYVPKQKVRGYIKRAGDFTRQADRKETRLIRADGEVLSGGSVLGMAAQLGDIVIVPTKVQKERDWNRAVLTTVSALTGILTSVYIVSKI